MAHTVRFLRTAERELHRLPAEVKSRIASRIDSLATEPRPPGSRRIVSSEPDLYRIRVGDYRIVYQVQDAEPQTIIVWSVGHRREVYRGL